VHTSLTNAGGNAGKDFGGYLAAMRDAIRRGDNRAAASAIDGAPQELSATAAWRCRILLPYYQFECDFDAGLKMLREIRDEELDRQDAAAIGDFLLATQNYDEAAAFLERMLVRFHDAPPLIRNYLVAIYLSRGPESFDAARARLLGGLGDVVAAQILAGVPPSWLAGKEVKFLIDHLSSLANKDAIALNIAESNDPQVLVRLSGQLALEGPRVRVIRRIVDSRIGGAESPRASREESKAESASLASDLDGMVRELVDTDARPCPSGEPSFAEAVAVLRHIGQRARAAWLNTNANSYEAEAFAAWLGDRIARREPTAVVRFGDGEGHFLPYPPSYAEFRDKDRSEKQQQMWGEEFFPGAEAERLADDLVSVAMNADAVGLITLIRLLRLYYRPSPAPSAFWRSMRGACNVANFFDGLAADTLRNKIVVAASVHADLNFWNLYPEILKAAPSVSTISCHDLSPFVARQFGRAIRCWHRIPAPGRHLGLFGYQREPGHERFYPGIFNRVLSEIAPEPGEVFLVAAGILGKSMCARIRAKGGIALDIGSIADYWMGFPTRTYGPFGNTFHSPPG